MTTNIQQIIDSFSNSPPSSTKMDPLHFFAQRFAVYQQNRLQIELQIVNAEKHLETTKQLCAKDAWKFAPVKGSKVKREDPRISTATQAIQNLFTSLSALEESAKDIIDFVEEQKAFEAKREAEGGVVWKDDQDQEPWTVLQPYKPCKATMDDAEEEDAEYEDAEPWTSNTSLTERYLRNLGEVTLVTMRLERASAASWNWNTPIGQKSYLQRCQERIKH